MTRSDWNSSLKKTGRSHRLRPVFSGGSAARVLRRHPGSWWEMRTRTLTLSMCMVGKTIPLPWLLCSLVVVPLLSAQLFLEAHALEIGSSAEQRYGAHIDAEDWVHFVVYSPAATAVDLLLYDNPQDTHSAHAIPMQRQSSDWRIKVKGEGVGSGLLYMYRASGPNDVSIEDRYGLMFNPQYPVNDPYAYRTQNVHYSAFFTAPPMIHAASPVYAGGGKSIVYHHSADLDPGHVRIDPQELILYELHVQDFTARLQSLEPGLRGTYPGLAKGGLTTAGGLTAGIDHLLELGINAVELMPVMEYDEETGNVADRLNHWGYMTANFFAPEARYAHQPGRQVIELKHLVKAFHDKGIAVFLDVVFNHTAEGKPWVHDGRLAAKCYNLRCLANTRIYRATPDGDYFWNATGTGNDVSFFGPDDRFTKRLVNDSLALWHLAYGFDGFRFDLARILADGSDSAADWVDNDQRFSAAHLHAEPWDNGGVWWDFMDSGPWSHSNNRWAKWLGRYRDKVRRFSSSGLRDRRAFKQLIEGYGSVSDNYGASASSRPWRSVNVVAVHDGYTLRDCTYFNDVGGSHNCWDSGGDETLRRERSKLLLGVLLTSKGVPLLLQGDEFGRTKAGAGDNAHNTYNYESSTGDAAINHVNWIDWRLKDGDNSATPEGGTYGKELFHWTKALIALRKTWSHFRGRDFTRHVHDVADGPGNDGRYTYTWEGPTTGSPSQLAVIRWGKAGEPDLMVIYNEHWEPFDVTNLGQWSKGDWKVLARSWFADDHDFCDPARWEATCPDAHNHIQVKGRSMAILVSDND